MLVAEIIVRPHYSFTAQESANFNNVYMETRRHSLQFALDAVRAHNFQAVSQIPDHQALYYFYLALLSAIKGGNPEVDIVFLGAQMKAAIFLLAIYPLMFFIITKSKAIAFLVPWLLDHFAGSLLYETKTDTYWVFGWIITLGVPLLLIHGGWNGEPEPLHLAHIEPSPKF